MTESSERVGAFESWTVNPQVPGSSPGRAKAYLQTVLPQVAKVLDFSRFSYESITAGDDRVVALINVGVAESEAMIKISEHWLIKDEKVLSLWVAYYEPQAVMERIERLPDLLAHVDFQN